MTARFPLAVVLGGVLALAACDSAPEGDSERVSGVWEGTLAFRADTVLADENYRIQADYDVDVRFDLVHDDGLAWGVVSAAFDGYLIAREAGMPADTFRFDPSTPMVDAAFGTFVRPELEIDVPWGPYDEDLWTFDKVGSRLDLENTVYNLWTFPLRNVADPGEFEFQLAMDDDGDVRFSRTSDDPVLPDSMLAGIGALPEPRRELMVVEGTRRRAVLEAVRTLAR